MSVYAVGNSELKRLPNVKRIEQCPSCGKYHRVDNPKDKDGCEIGISLITCPKSGLTYLVGIKGKRVSNKKRRS